MSQETTGATAQAAPPATPTEQPAAAPQEQPTDAPKQVTEGADAPETQELELTPGAGRSAARKRVAERMKARQERAVAEAERAERAREKALGQPRKDAGTPEGGQFAKEQGQQDGPAEPGAEAASPAEPPAGAEAPVPADTAKDSAKTVTTAQAAKTPEGMVDIPLPEGHPWRDRGKTFLRVATEFENESRAGINAAMRVRSAEAERDRLARDHALLEARQKAAGEVPQFEGDPKWQALLKQVREADGFGDEMAAQIEAALKARSELAVVKAEGTAAQEFERTHMAGRIEDEILGGAHQVLQVWANNGEMWRVPQLVRQYFAAVDTRNAQRGTDQPPNAREFFEWVKPAYANDPRVQQQVQALRTQEQQRKEAQIRADERQKAERERAEAAKAAALKQTQRPPTAPPRSPRQPVTTTPPAPEREAPRPGSIRKQAQQRAREIAERRLGRTP